MNRNIIIAIVLLITLIFLLIMIPKELYTPQYGTEPVKLNPIPDYHYIDYDTKIHDDWFEAEHHIKIYKKKESEILGLSNELSKYLLSEGVHKIIKDDIKDFSEGKFISYDENLIKVLDRVFNKLDINNIETYVEGKQPNECNYSCQKIIHDFNKRDRITFPTHLNKNERDKLIKEYAINHPDHKLNNDILDSDESYKEIIGTLRKFIDLNKQYVELKNLDNYIDIKKTLIDNNKDKYYNDNNDETIYSDLEDYIGEQLLKENPVDTNYKITIDKFYDYIMLQEPYKLKVLIYFILKKYILKKLDDRFNTVPKLPCVYYSKSKCPKKYCDKVENPVNDNIECMPKKINKPIKYCEVVSKYGKDYCEMNYQETDDLERHKCVYNNNICSASSANNPGITSNITADKKKRILEECLKIPDQNTCENLPIKTKCVGPGGYETQILNPSDCRYSKTHKLCVPKDYDADDIKCHYFDDSRYINYKKPTGPTNPTCPTGQTGSTCPTIKIIDSPDDLFKKSHENLNNINLDKKEELCNKLKTNVDTPKCRFVKHYLKNTKDKPFENKYFSKCVPVDSILKPEYIQFDSYKGIDLDKYGIKQSKIDNKCNTETGTGEWEHNRCIPTENKCEKIKNKLLCNNIKIDGGKKCLWESSSEKGGYCYNKLIQENKINSLQGNITGRVKDNNKFEFVTDLFFDEAIRDSDKKRLFDTLSVNKKKRIQLAIDVKARKLGGEITKPSTTTA